MTRRDLHHPAAYAVHRLVACPSPVRYADGSAAYCRCGVPLRAKSTIGLFGVAAMLFAAGDGVVVPDTMAPAERRPA